ncbi:hypothetical protein DRQ25_07890 [Candidatus Fermentibacteria bacterium]|nr:MAG: hypothetical protein DRQ25_07890 [Candidatus Fermentibacteria bacterium]
MIPRKLLDGERVAGARVDGSWVEGVPVGFTFRASVQPVVGKELDNTPSIRRHKGAVYKLYSNDELFTIKENTQPDIVTLYSIRCEIVEKQIWQNNIRPHYKYYAAEKLTK